jgi:hypothetical protein
MRYYKLEIDNLLVTQEQLDKLSEVLEGSKYFTVSWKDKTMELETDPTSQGVKFVPVSSAAVADMMMRHKQKLEEA